MSIKRKIIVITMRHRPGEFDALPDLVEFLECLHAVSAKWEAAVFAANPHGICAGFRILSMHA